MPDPPAAEHCTVVGNPSSPISDAQPEVVIFRPVEVFVKESGFDDRVPAYHRARGRDLTRSDEHILESGRSGRRAFLHKGSPRGGSVSNQQEVRIDQVGGRLLFKEADLPCKVFRHPTVVAVQ